MQPVGDEQRFRLPARKPAQEGELVAAEAGDRIPRPRQVVERPGHCTQQRVAALVPERVVDLLEAVEVEEEQADVFTAFPARLELRFETLEEERPVRQLGERVVQRLMLNLLHLRSQLRARPPEERQKQHVEPEQHELEHAGDRKERMPRSARDRPVVLVEHERAGDARPVRPQRHICLEHFHVAGRRRDGRDLGVGGARERARDVGGVGHPPAPCAEIRVREASVVAEDRRPERPAEQQALREEAVEPGAP